MQSCPSADVMVTTIFFSEPASQRMTWRLVLRSRRSSKTCRIWSRTQISRGQPGHARDVDPTSGSRSASNIGVCEDESWEGRERLFGQGGKTRSGIYKIWRGQIINEWPKWGLRDIVARYEKLVFRLCNIIQLTPKPITSIVSTVSQLVEEKNTCQPLHRHSP